MNPTARLLVGGMGMFVLLCVALPPVAPVKARATRITGVNNLAPLFPKRNFELTVVGSVDAPVQKP